MQACNFFWLVPLLSALLGSLVGGFVAHLNARYIAERQEQRQIEQEERREKSDRLAVAYSIVFKVQTGVELITQIYRYVATARAHCARHGWPLWRAMEEFLDAERERFSFTSAELALFAIHRDADFVNDLQELATIHNLLTALFREYNPRREAFGERAAEKGSVTLAGKTASFETDDPAAHLRAFRLEQLANFIAKTADDGAPHVVKIANSLTAKLVKILDDPRFNANLHYPPEMLQVPKT